MSVDYGIAAFGDALFFALRALVRGYDAPPEKNSKSTSHDGILPHC